MYSTPKPTKLLDLNNKQIEDEIAKALNDMNKDDLKDKVFVAIVKALFLLRNKPSSPKELALCIIRNKLTMLGGSTPYATVSSRISQHFKRCLNLKEFSKKSNSLPMLRKLMPNPTSKKIKYCLAIEENNDDNKADDYLHQDSYFKDEVGPSTIEKNTPCYKGKTVKKKEQKNSTPKKKEGSENKPNDTPPGEKILEKSKITHYFSDGSNNNKLNKNRKSANFSEETKKTKSIESTSATETKRDLNETKTIDNISMEDIDRMLIEPIALKKRKTNNEISTVILEEPANNVNNNKIVKKTYKETNNETLENIYYQNIKENNQKKTISYEINTFSNAKIIEIKSNENNYPVYRIIDTTSDPSIKKSGKPNKNHNQQHIPVFTKKNIGFIHINSILDLTHNILLIPELTHFVEKLNTNSNSQTNTIEVSYNNKYDGIWMSITATELFLKEHLVHYLNNTSIKLALCKNILKGLQDVNTDQQFSASNIEYSKSLLQKETYSNLEEYFDLEERFSPEKVCEEEVYMQNQTRKSKWTNKNKSEIRNKIPKSLFSPVIDTQDECNNSIDIKISIVDTILVYVTCVYHTDNANRLKNSYLIRRVDTDFVNVSLFPRAFSSVDRSMLITKLSFCNEKVSINYSNSLINGAWVPLNMVTNLLDSATYTKYIDFFKEDLISDFKTPFDILEYVISPHCLQLLALKNIISFKKNNGEKALENIEANCAESINESTDSNTDVSNISDNQTSRKDINAFNNKKSFNPYTLSPQFPSILNNESELNDKVHGLYEEFQNNYTSMNEISQIQEYDYSTEPKSPRNNSELNVITGETDTRSQNNGTSYKEQEESSEEYNNTTNDEDAEIDINDDDTENITNEEIEGLLDICGSDQ